MASEARVADVTSPLERTRPAIRDAGRVVLVAAGLGLLGQLLFFDVGLGINFPIAMGLLLGSAWGVRRPGPLDPLDLWLAPAALVFASFAALRADATLVALDVLTAITLAGAAVTSFGGRTVVTRSMGAVIGLAMATIGWMLSGAVPALGDAQRSLPSTAAVGRRASPAMPVLRGLAVAVPVALVFVVLFSSADAVFARMVDDLFGIDLDFGEGMWRLVLAIVLAWIASGTLALAASSPRPAAAPRGDVQPRWRAGSTEIVTVLVAVVAVFGLFVILQVAYLFGGRDTLDAAGISYAEYARRGFFELVAVAVLAGGLTVAADRFARVRTTGVVVAAMALAALTGVVLVSAALRLRLYQDAYGWTELRLYVLATIAVLAIGILGLLVALATARVRWMGHLLIVAVLAVGLVLNVIGPVRFITEQNIARVAGAGQVERSPGLDDAYVTSLDDDAIPILVRALPGLDARSASHVATELAFRLDELRADDGLNAWQAWNAGRSAARDALQAAELRGDLP